MIIIMMILMIMIIIIIITIIIIIIMIITIIIGLITIITLTIFRLGYVRGKKIWLHLATYSSQLYIVFELSGQCY